MITKNIKHYNPNIEYGKRFKADMSISLTELKKEIDKAQAYVDQLTEELLVFGGGDGSPKQDSALSWDNINKTLSSTHISCTDIVLENGVVVDEFSNDGTLAGNSDSAIPTEKAVKTYADIIEASAVLIDGTRELTSDWDAGSHKITAEQFESDIATGTPPFVVVSETLVDNLNADMWDGYDFDDYLDQDMKTTASPSLTGLTISGLTENSIPYIGAGGAILEDNANFAWNNTTKTLNVNTGNIILGNGYVDAKTYYYLNGSRLINIDGNNNMFLGIGAAASKTTAYQSMAIGPNALNSVTTQYYNVAIGSHSLYNSVSSINLAIGPYSAYTLNNSSAQYNTVIGYLSLYSATNTSYNVAIGDETLRYLTTGNTHVAIGHWALRNITIYSQCIAIGAFSQENNNAVYNTSIGSSSLRTLSNTSAEGNFALGHNAMYYANHADVVYNVAIGFRSMFNGNAPSKNIGIGYYSLYNASGGSNNLGIGYNVMYNLTNGSYMLAIGDEAFYSATTASGGVAIGREAGYYETGSNKLFIDNQKRSNEANGRVSSLIYGEFNSTVSSQLIRFNTGTFEINSGGDNDITCNFTGTTNSGVLKWMEDEDYFEFQDDVKIGDGENIVLDTTNGTKIGTSTIQKLGFFGATPIIQPSEITDELTTITYTAPATPDYAIQNLTNSGGYGFATQDEGNTVLSVIENLQLRVNELENTLNALGLLADAD